MSSNYSCHPLSSAFLGPLQAKFGSIKLAICYFLNTTNKTLL